MLKNAIRICDAKFGSIYRWDGQVFHSLATHNTPAAYAKARKRLPQVPPHPKSMFGQIVATRSVVHFADTLQQAAYREGVPSTVAAAELGGVRTALGVPMLEENELSGAFTLFRHEVRPFAEKQIELVQNFAAQAVIAIENARLLSELRQSLEQQTATGEILSSMSGSIADTKPVFSAIVRNLLRLFGTRFATVMLLKDSTIYLPALMVRRLHASSASIR
jgi:GAF domain-containing protein